MPEAPDASGTPARMSKAFPRSTVPLVLTGKSGRSSCLSGTQDAQAKATRTLMSQ
ncbi:MAG: hypothetical protein LBQ79_05560 [Deltaproteobacteria bacterium]|nr:hypothetical protein [Deltaproteobacteria bacterium]